MKHSPVNHVIACVVIYFYAALVFLGWTLSSFQLLTRPVYLPLLLALLLFWLIWMFPGLRHIAWSRSRARRLMTRMRRPLPLIFFIALVLGIVGGLIYPPNNYDALSYRIPRVLAWISDGHWFWIPTTNDRMNYSGTVQEWLFCPLLMAFQSDRMLFIVNVISLALIPGLVFSLFRSLGIRSGVVWWWMWLVPLCMGIALQAGGIGNDLLGVFFFLAATTAAVRFRGTGSLAVLIFSILSISLCTGVKLSNLPLVLPWLALLAPVWKPILRQGWKALLIAAFSVVVSILPTLALNWMHTGSWTGDPDNRYGLGLHNPVAGIVGNTVMIAANNLTPPILPFANRIEALANNIPPFRSDSWLKQRFPNFGILLNELPQEEASGAGLLILLLLIWSLLRSNKPVSSFSGLTVPGLRRQDTLVFFVAYVMAALCFLAMMGSDYPARLFLPYTPPLIAFILWLRDSSPLVRTVQWRFVTAVFGVITLGVVILSPSRPLFPVSAAINVLRKLAPANISQRTEMVYATYAHRADAFTEVREDLTNDDTVLGFLSSGNDLETSLWRPYGFRKVVHILPTSNPATLAAEGVSKVLISRRAVELMPDSSRQQLAWLLRQKSLATYHIRQFASQDEDLFSLVRLEFQPQ